MESRRSAKGGSSDPLAAAASRSLRDLASGPTGGLITRSFRTVPQQERAMESVERLLAAVERLVRRARSLDGLTLEAVALEAKVTPQAAYRYFRDVRDVVRLFVRRVEAVEHEGLIAALTEPRFETDTELAAAAVRFIVRACREIFALPPKVRSELLRDHAEICYDALWTVADAVCATFARSGDPCSGIDVLALNAALVSTLSLAISLSGRGEALIADPRAQALMAKMFLAAIR